jgi:hypothetical protein
MGGERNGTALQRRCVQRARNVQRADQCSGCQIQPVYSLCSSRRASLPAQQHPWRSAVAGPAHIDRKVVARDEALQGHDQLVMAGALELVHAHRRVQRA